MPHASFNKQTSHNIIKDIKVNHPAVLPFFKVDEKERQYRIWQRDPLAILMDFKNKLGQKLTYIHNNPLHERWNLAEKPELYPWSSANFYETGIDDFGFLTHYMERFG
jgi:putative transposase